MFRKDYWKRKGRWYSIKVESNGNSISLVRSDLPATVAQTSSASYVLLDNPKFRVLAYSGDITYTTNPSGAYPSIVGRSNKVNIQLPAPGVWTEIEIMVFGYIGK